MSGDQRDEGSEAFWPFGGEATAPQAAPAPARPARPRPVGRAEAPVVSRTGLRLPRLPSGPPWPRAWGGPVPAGVGFPDVALLLLALTVAVLVVLALS